ncbi:hypothetical protein MMC10_004650 [Thelotrema lepadinum]|nr:hypothetical protein [Thelotrema lepadinum]
MFRRIGAGFCGSVWAPSEEHNTNIYAIKRGDGGSGRSLHNDYIMHQKAIESLSTSYVRVPGCHQYIDAEDRSWWDLNISKFPENVQIPCNALVSDRIPPFRQKIRETLIDAYCPTDSHSLIKTSEPDQDCLIRIYLGRRRRHVKQSKFHAFSLRNYPLHIDQVEE